MNSLFISKYKPAIILTLALAVFLVSCISLPTTTPRSTTTPGWVVSTLAGSGRAGHQEGADTAAQFNLPSGVAVDSSGNVYVADKLNNRIRKITPAGVVTTIAGSDTWGHHDATGTAARFNLPNGVAVDSSGNLYVADFNNHRIRKITSTGMVTTLAGTGTAGFKNGPGTAAQFHNPYGVAVDSSGNLYVADAVNNRIRKITPAGVVTTLAGSGTVGHHDATGTAAEFNEPYGVAVDSSGNIYVADSGNNRIRKITSGGKVTTIAGSGRAGNDDATGTAAQFNFPTGVAVDSSGNIYVADTENHLIRRITSAGVVSTLAGSSTWGAGYRDATGTAAQFDLPIDVAVDSSGNIYVADHNNHRIRKITPEGDIGGDVTSLAGSTWGYKDGTGTAAQFNGPYGVAVDSSGNLYVADANNNRIRKITSEGGVTTFAGSTAGHQNGTGTAAQFNGPSGVAVDSSGNLYVADYDNHRIRKITSEGVVTTFAGSTAGHQNGTGTAARFNGPSGVAVDSSGNVYVADYNNHRIRKITPGGVVTTLAGTGTEGYKDATGTAAQFNTPHGVAVDSSGILYVAGLNNHRIRKITSEGVVTTLAGTGTEGYKDATGSVAQFNGPSGVAVDSSGILYVTDTYNNRIRKITSEGVVSTIAGDGTTAQFYNPTGVAVDSSGILYVADLNNHRIRKITSERGVSPLVGTGTAGHQEATGTAAEFNEPSGVAVDSSGILYVADANNHRIRKITSERGVSPLASTGTAGHQEATGTAARFNEPSGVAVDSSGNLYVADANNHRIRKISSEGVVSTFAGDGTTAQFYNPTGVAVDSFGNLYVADTDNHRIRKITPGGVVTTFAGSTEGYKDATGTAAQFYNPTGVAVDSSGILYVADTDNHRIRKISSEGVVSTFAGSTAGHHDGTGTAAQFNFPSSVAVDSSGNLYVADANNHRIRKISSEGVVSTIAGTGTAGHHDGTGTATRFNFPSSVAVDSSGNLYVADFNNHRIRKITSEGVVTTLAGTGTAGHHDGTGTATRFNYPSGVAVDSSGILYVADTDNHRIRKITSEGVVTTLAGTGTAGLRE